jgi:hypothetical protein
MSEETVDKLDRGLNKLWFIIHNCVAHPLLVTEKDWAVEFHNWTADRMEE